MHPRWLGAAFVIGVTVGVVATRVLISPPNEAEAVAAQVPDETRIEFATVQAVEPPDVGAPRIANPELLVHPERAATVDLEGTQSAQAIAAEAGGERIDAGEVFNAQFAQTATPGTENTLANAHRALEREVRDDGWAYTMEAELQNAMVNEVSTGAFRADHLECRATLCEVRLSGTAEQAAAIKRWADGLGTQPFGQRLYLRHGSTISDGERVDSMMIFLRPPRR